jgi:hypothetical protein
VAMCSNDDSWKGLSRDKPHRQFDPCCRSTYAEHYVTADPSDTNNNASENKVQADIPANENLESPKKILDRGPLYLRQRIFNRDSGLFVLISSFILVFVLCG